MPFHQGLLDATGRGIGSLFGGRVDPRVSPEQNVNARSDALVQAGLATLLAQGPDGLSPTLLQALAQGAIVGREQGAASREQSLQRNQQEQLQQLVDSGEVGPEMLQQLFTQAIATGNVEAMRALSGVLPAALSATQGGPLRTTTIDIVDPNDPSKVRRQLINQNDGSVIRDLGEAPRAASAASTRITAVDPETGRKAVFVLNPDNTLGQRIAFTETEMGTGPERINQKLGEAGANAARLLDTVDVNLASIMPQLAARGGPITSAFANMLIDDDAQAAVAAAVNFINPVVRYLSGAQMTDKEAQRYYKALIPGVGDNPRTIEIKRAMRANIITAMGSGEWEGIAINGEANITNADAWLAQAQAQAQAVTQSSGSATNRLRGLGN